MNCLGYVLILAAAAFALLTLLRLFEQITDSVTRRLWHRTFLFLACPFAVWFFPSRVSAGRPTPVPRHEPVRGFGSLPKAKPTSSPPTHPSTPTPPPPSPTDDQPPPGTPPEFLVKPQVPPKRVKPLDPIDPEKVAKLRQKMKDQGMLDE